MMSLKIFAVLITLGVFFKEVVPEQKGSPSHFAGWNSRSKKTGVACESHKLFLKCPNRSERLMIQSTFYGRQDQGICQHQIIPFKGQCSEDEELINKKIVELCANENKCSIAASRDFLLQDGKDKCPHLYKYLSVDYKCVQTPHIFKKCLNKKCVAPAKCWPYCSKDCCEPSPPPKWNSEELSFLREQWSAGGYNPEFPQQHQDNEKRYNIPGTYLYGMRNTAQTPGYARSRLNYPQPQRNYGYYKALTKPQVPTNQQVADRKSAVPVLTYNTQRMPVQYQASVAQQRSYVQSPGYQPVQAKPAYQQQHFTNYMARSNIQNPSIQNPNQYQKYANYLQSLKQYQPRQ